MRTLLRGILPLALVLSAPAQDLVVPAGTVQGYDTIDGPLVVDSLTIEDGAVLRVSGPFPFRLTARNEVRVDGLLDLSGADSVGVLTLNTTHLPELGAAGGPGAGRGGTGSPLTSASSPAGGIGLGAAGLLDGGGRGGETGYTTGSSADRRGAGGGGGALAADQSLPGLSPFDEANRGLVAQAGRDGSPSASGALSGTAPPQGGSIAPRAFQDGDPSNDFWGLRLVGGQAVAGELARPVAGVGGGAGGDAVQSATFPLLPFSITGDEKGAGGGGGGGLGVVIARQITLGPQGRILAEGGDGGAGENTFFFDRIGGGSGGGSGGMLVLQALRFDFSAVQGEALSARGGRGGAGAMDVYPAVGSGGPGGPGVIQLHTPSGGMGELLLPPQGLEAISAPDALVLLPFTL